MGDEAVALPAGKVERAPRLNTHEYCVIARQNGRAFPAVLVNLSERGFCVESNTPLENDEQIEVRVLGARLRGSVRWTKCRRAGGMLHDAAV
jgi:hypothetical protein